MDLQAKLSELGFTLPQAPKAVASYVPAVKTGSQVVVSGQLPFVEGQLPWTGAVPEHVSEEQAQKAAEVCVLNGLAVLGDVLGGDFGRLVQVVKVGVFVQSPAGYGGQPKVANGASDLLLKLLGEKGRHARAAVGVSSLPLNAPVEVEFVFEIA